MKTYQEKDEQRAEGNQQLVNGRSKKKLASDSDENYQLALENFCNGLESAVKVYYMQRASDEYGQQAVSDLSGVVELFRVGKVDDLKLTAEALDALSQAVMGVEKNSSWGNGREACRLLADKLTEAFKTLIVMLLNARKPLGRHYEALLQKCTNLTKHCKMLEAKNEKHLLKLTSTQEAHNRFLNETIVQLNETMAVNGQTGKTLAFQDEPKEDKHKSYQGKIKKYCSPLRFAVISMLLQQFESVHLLQDCMDEHHVVTQEALATLQEKLSVMEKANMWVYALILDSASGDPGAQRSTAKILEQQFNENAPKTKGVTFDQLRQRIAKHRQQVTQQEPEKRKVLNPTARRNFLKTTGRMFEMGYWFKKHAGYARKLKGIGTEIPKSNEKENIEDKPFDLK